jgi:uncharacterized cupin superfamily protein
MNLLDCDLPAADMPPGFLHRWVSVREALGGEHFGCSLYEFDSREQLWPYHYHWANEEWLVVVAGTPTLRDPGGERELAVGDVVAFPEGEAGAHTLTNRTAETARVAIFSTRRHGSVTYPDSDKLGAGPPHERHYFRRGDAVDYWDGEQ